MNKWERIWHLVPIFIIGALLENLFARFLTLYAVSHGAVELDPVSKALLSVSPFAFIALSLLIFLVFYLLFLRIRKSNPFFTFGLSLSLFVVFSFDFIHDALLVGGVL